MPAAAAIIAERAARHTPGRRFAALEQRRRRIPAMDLLIAVAALVDGASLVTRNRKDFADVSGLTVLGY